VVERVLVEERERVLQSESREGRVFIPRLCFRRPKRHLSLDRALRSPLLERSAKKANEQISQEAEGIDLDTGSSTTILFYEGVNLQ